MLNITDKIVLIAASDRPITLNVTSLQLITAWFNSLRSSSFDKVFGWFLGAEKKIDHFEKKNLKSGD